MTFQSLGETFAVAGIPTTSVVPFYSGPVTHGWQMLLVALPSVLAFLTSCVAAFLGFKNQKRIAKTSGQVQELHLVVNSRLDALVEATRRSAHAEGLIEGTQTERAEQADRAAHDHAKATGPAGRTDPEPVILLVPDTRPSG
jgi:hypothetical protein